MGKNYVAILIFFRCTAWGGGTALAIYREFLPQWLSQHCALFLPYVPYSSPQRPYWGLLFVFQMTVIPIGGGGGH